jgi:hypothetical protein
MPDQVRHDELAANIIAIREVAPNRLCEFRQLSGPDMNRFDNILISEDLSPMRRRLG